MMMPRPFATFLLVLLAATLNPATANFTNYRVMITRGAYDEQDCTAAVNDVIDQTIAECAALATGTAPLHPKRKLNLRRALRTMPASSRRLCSGSTCSATCIMLGYCADTCQNCNNGRGLEEEFLGGGDAVESIREERELNPTDDVLIYVECKKQIKNLARDATHNCLGEFSALDIEVVTSD
jgi:hypothetical protein